MTEPTNRPASTRPVMGREELARHALALYYDLRDAGDGHDRAERLRGDGWHVLSLWGARGYPLGSWPYVMVHGRRSDVPGGTRAWDVLVDVEGDIAVYRFSSESEMRAAIDYLFVRHLVLRQDTEVSGITLRQLDAGSAAVPDDLRGPFEGQYR